MWGSPRTIREWGDQQYSMTNLSSAICLCLLAVFGLSIQGAELEADSVFGLKKLSEIHLTIQASEWAKLQPSHETDWDVGKAFQRLGEDAQGGGHFHSEKSSRPGLAGYLGLDHQYGKADLSFNGELVRDVGLRFKGNGTFIEGWDRGKLSFKIDFNEFVEGQEFRGLTKINLQSNIFDPSMLREALSYELFREAGIVCPRVGWGRVKLTVTGEFEGKDLGLYSLVEQVDGRLLEDRLGSAKGLLMKPSTFGIFRFFGEEWGAYEKGYFPKTDPTPEQKQHLIDFARLVHQADDATFDEKIDAFLDVNQFLRFLSVNVLLCNLDSFLGGSQNYYVYLEPESNRFQLMPWDMDHSFGAFRLAGNRETRLDLSIYHPHWGANELIDRVLSIPRHVAAYQEILQSYLDTVFVEAKLRERIEELAGFLRPLIASSAFARPADFERIVSTEDGPNYRPGSLMYFIENRRASVESQLLGESNGQVLSFNGFPDLRWIGLALLGAIILNLIAYIWSVVAGFRNNKKWGFLNCFLYPVAPAIYGFRICPALGRRAAVMSLISFLILIVTAVILFRIIVSLEG